MNVQVNLSDNSIEYLHADINGSVIAVTTDNGYLGGITNYGAYGKRQGSAISRFGFAGEWTDPTTSYTYLRARWYDPNIGSFLSKDPLYEITQEAYGYANGNPLTNIDPSGLMGFDTNFLNDFVSNANREFEEKVHVAKSVISNATNTVLTGAKNAYQGTINFAQKRVGQVGNFVNTQVAPNVAKAQNLVKKGLKWTLDNSGNISFALGAGALATANPITAPISGILATGSLIAGGVAVVYDVSKCVGLIYENECDKTSLGLNFAGTLTGGIGAMVGKGIGKALSYSSHVINSYSFSRGSVLSRRSKTNIEGQC